MRRVLTLGAAALALLLARPAPAAADITAFLGFSPTPDYRGTTGVAVSLNLLLLGFEFEYGHTREDEPAGSPRLRTGMLNAVLSTPTSGVRLYVTAGGGFYREGLGAATETSVGTNVGGGATVELAGPLRLRLDYRVFSLRGSPLHRTPKRLYAGLTLAF